MADIDTILSPPSSAGKGLVAHPRRPSIPTIIKPTRITFKQQQPNAQSETTHAQQHHSPTYHIHTLLLFTYSDIKNILLPQTLLAFVTTLTCSTNPTSTLLSRLPLTLLWTWLHLLIFNISNQRQPTAHAEDALNKPWRPLPSHRLTLPQARRLFISVSVVAALFSVCVGGLVPSLTLMGLYVLNNDFALGDSSPVGRNTLNAAGYTTFAVGAISVLIHGTDVELTYQGYQWLAFIAGVILTTGQCQDLEDQDGDGAAGRKTIPLLLGERAARWSVIVPMAVWTVCAVRFWGCGFRGSVGVFSIGAVVVKRLAVGGDAKGYKTTFRLWNCWVVGLYLLPLFERRV